MHLLGSSIYGEEDTLGLYFKIPASRDCYSADRPVMILRLIAMSSENPSPSAKAADLVLEMLEARVGIEPTDKGFADLSLTTWVPRLLNSR